MPGCKHQVHLSSSDNTSFVRIQMLHMMLVMYSVPRLLSYQPIGHSNLPMQICSNARLTPARYPEFRSSRLETPPRDRILLSCY